MPLTIGVPESYSHGNVVFRACYRNGSPDRKVMTVDQDDVKEDYSIFAALSFSKASIV